MALIATPGAVDSNSYATLAEANLYHASTLNASAWTTASDATKETALQWATRLLDEQVEWVGEIVSADQALRWPRFDVYTRDGIAFDSDSIPTFLKNATAELAKQLIASDRTAESSSLGISELQVDVVKIVFDKTESKAVLPPAVYNMVKAYGTANDGSGFSMAKLIRA